MRHNLLLLAVLVALSFAALGYLARSAVATAQDSDDTIVGLPQDKGRDEVNIYCLPCHSLRLVVQQGLTREQWAELLVWMVEEQEMEPIPDEDRVRVLDYLTKHVGPDSQKQRLRERGILR